MAAKMQITYDFYKKMNPDMLDKDIYSHMEGIDFTKPVEVVNYGEGKQLFQYTKVNTEGSTLRGDYYTDDPNATPSELGISDKYSVKDPNEGWKQTDQVNTVEQQAVTLENNVEGLKSTSAEINDIWSLKDESVPTEGGGSQIYIPKNQ